MLQRFGNRGYRAVQLEAGILGGKMYLCAGALGLGASGLTFYDDDVTAFFTPHATGKSAIFVVALGQTARREPGAPVQVPRRYATRCPVPSGLLRRPARGSQAEGRGRRRSTRRRNFYDGGDLL